jgi:hypothetical protein
VERAFFSSEFTSRIGISADVRCKTFQGKGKDRSQAEKEAIID